MGEDSDADETKDMNSYLRKELSSSDDELMLIVLNFSFKSFQVLFNKVCFLLAQNRKGKNKQKHLESACLILILKGRFG